MDIKYQSALIKKGSRTTVMDVKFMCEEMTARISAIGGGNFLLLSKNRSSCLSACEIAVNVMSKIDNIITPFPRALFGLGLKLVKYKALIASTNDAFCPSMELQEASFTRVLIVSWK